MKVWGALLLVLLWGACPAFAGTAVVTAGEHSGFTRVVVQFDAAVDWQLGRGPQGYTLRITPQAPKYDLKTVFNLIGKTRLTATQVDPATGDLVLSLTCTCYAMPYEQRAGVVVIDLRDGVAPVGSSFEVPLEKLATQGQPKVDVLKPTYDWTALPVPAAGQGALPLLANLGAANPLPSQTLEALRLSLIQDLSRGASQGVVDLIVPKQSVTDQPADLPPLPGQVQIGPNPNTDPNLATRQSTERPVALTAQGASCFQDDQLDLTVWGGQQPVAAQMGPARHGLTTEFDTPDPAAATRAIRFQLFLGFGAEARSLIRAFAPNAPDAALWHSMAQILDAKADPASAFAGMQECETSAALWATLADAKTLPTSPQAKAAVLRRFSALPPHLRRLLGPDLVGRFITAGDLAQATALYDATLRAAGDQSSDLVLMQAQMDHALGKPDAAMAQVSALAKAPGSGAADALVELIEAQAPLGQPIPFAQVQALEAFVTERRGGPQAARFERALVLAKAGSGDFAGAFAALDGYRDLAPTVWRLLAQSAPDSALLTFASMAPDDPVPPEAEAFAPQIASRMLGLGLSDQAGLWAAHAPQSVVAQIKVAQGDAQAALDLLQTNDSPEALALKAQAYQALGQPKEAAGLYAHLGQTDDHWHAIRQAGDWQTLATQGPALWKEVAALLTNLPPDASIGPLAQDKALIAQSMATREAILALLDQTKAPLFLTQ